MTFSERIYRIMLQAYPAEYLKRYGHPMAQAFGDQVRAATTIPKFIRLWRRTLSDWATTVAARHLDQRNARKLWRSWSEEGRRAVFFARYEASWLGHAEITVEDLLLGALRADRAFAANALGEAVVRDLRDELGSSALGLPRSHWKCRIAHPTPLSDSCKRALSRAMEEASHSGAAGPTPRHLIGGIVQEEGSLAANVLLRHGADLPQIRSRYS
jgi:hypothetical protein